MTGTTTTERNVYAETTEPKATACARAFSAPSKRSLNPFPPWRPARPRRLPFLWSSRAPATPHGSSIFWPRAPCCWSDFASADSRVSARRRDRSTLTPQTRCRRPLASPPPGDCCSLISPPAHRWQAERSITQPSFREQFFHWAPPAIPTLAVVCAVAGLHCLPRRQAFR